MQAKSSIMEETASLYVCHHDDLFHLDQLFEDDGSGAESVLSDDIWRKFNLDYLDDLMLHHEQQPFDACHGEKTVDDDDPWKISRHDCMWAGHCASKEHPISEQPSVLYANTFCPTVPTIGRGKRTTSTIQTPSPHPSGRSLLLKANATAQCQKQQQQQSNQQQVQNVNSTTATTTATVQQQQQTPDSPPMSDDEEGKSALLDLLNEAIQECDDNDLCDYFEDDDDEIIKDPQDYDEDNLERPEAVKLASNQQQQQQQQRHHHQRTHIPTKEHSYHKDVSATMRMTHLGIETPSDSEEEIDVVSVTDKYNSSGRNACTLPTNPSSRDRQHLQRTMASAISNKRMIGGQQSTGAAVGNGATKPTMAPLRSVKQETNLYNNNDSNIGHHHQQQRRGIKRTRISTGLVGRSPTAYKKRGGSTTTTASSPTAHNSSDSEPEPSEKRSLHNNMERQRRIDLRNAFEDLRLLVPEVSKRERAPKVVILREASVYCDRLGDQSERLDRQVEELRLKQERLRAKVSSLRRSLAASNKHR